MEEMNLEEIRSQFAILKEQLTKQEIVSDRLFRETMKAKNKDINYVKKFAYWIAPICVILYLPLYFMHQTSLAFIIVTCLMLVACLVCTYYVHKPVDSLNFMTDDFASVARVMTKFNKQKKQILYASLPVMVLWAAWACYEMVWKHDLPKSFSWVLTISMLIGGIVGGIWGYCVERKAMNAAQDIIDEIEKN